jgi:hypothetical protein
VKRSRAVAFALASAVGAASCGDDATSSSSGEASTASGSSQGGAAATGSGGTSGTGAGAGSASTSSADTTGASSSQGSGGAPQLCVTCGEPTDAGVVANEDVQEMSGLAASRVHDGILYAHNDSGDGPRFFAMTLAGEDRGTFTVPAAEANDWEEMAAGPCGDGAPGCLYFADFGDNDEVRDDYVLYRVREPETVGAGLEAEAPAEAFPFSYPDGSHNAEAFVVHPTTGVVTIFTKAVTSRVFELAAPLAPGVVATVAGEITFDSFVSLATAADVDQAATVLAVRTYADVLLFPIPAGGTVAEALATPSCAAPKAAEAQGEAIAFLPGGTSYVTASEGASSTLHRVDCPL